MSSGRHYPNAPITEAVLDLRVMTAPGTNAADLAKVRAGDETAYPTAEPLMSVIGHMMIGPTPTTSTVQQQTGFVFRRQDGRYIHQARLDGFTISQLPPYSEWPDFRTEAQKQWVRYKEIARPIGITRAALRYVNRLDIPAPLERLSDYLRLRPQIPEELPQTPRGYFMQLALPTNTEGVVMITETIIPPSKPGVVSIVLDIDTFREYATPASDEEAWASLDKLRDLKNDVFEACIEDKARELFQ